MLIIGARGMAKELFEILHQHKYAEEIFFYDDVSNDAPKEIYGSSVLRHIHEAAALFKKNKNFVLGLGNPLLRKKNAGKIYRNKWKPAKSYQPFANIGTFGNTIGDGCNIMTGATITNDISFGAGVLININASVSHDCIIGEFAEIAPGAVITGRCHIGAFSMIGSNATILPDVRIGNNVIVGAGAVVTKNISDNAVVAGVPAKPFKKIS